MGRRDFLGWAAAAMAASSVPRAFAALDTAQANAVKLPPLHAPRIEAGESTPDPSLPPSERIGFAVATWLWGRFFPPSAIAGTRGPSPW